MSWIGFASKIASPFKWILNKSNRCRLLGARVEVIACVLTRNPTPSILLARSPYHDMWMPPQEGVNFQDSFSDSVHRCLKDECGINIKSKTSPIQIRSIHYVGTLKLEKNRNNERPVADDAVGTWIEIIPLRKKAYWRCSMIISSQSYISPKPNNTEVLELKWFSLEDAKNIIMETNHADKSELLIKVLESCQKDIFGA